MGLWVTVLLWELHENKKLMNVMWYTSPKFSSYTFATKQKRQTFPFERDLLQNLRWRQWIHTETDRNWLCNDTNMRMFNKAHVFKTSLMWFLETNLLSSLGCGLGSDVRCYIQNSWKLNAKNKPHWASVHLKEITKATIDLKANDY